MLSNNMVDISKSGIPFWSTAVTANLTRESVQIGGFTSFQGYISEADIGTFETGLNYNTG